MRKSIVVVVVCGVLAGCGSEPETTTDTSTEPAGIEPSEGVDRSQPDRSAPVEALVAGFNDAGFGLLKTLPETDNVVFSPSSIGHALLMARDAGDETTRAAIDRAVGLPDGLAAHKAWNVVDHRLAEQVDPDVTVAVADGIWPRADLQPDQD